MGALEKGVDFDPLMPRQCTLNSLLIFIGLKKLQIKLSWKEAKGTSASNHEWKVNVVFKISTLWEAYNFCSKWWENKTFWLKYLPMVGTFLRNKISRGTLSTKLVINVKNTVTLPWKEAEYKHKKKA